jgi:hypothetical protein
MLPRAPINEISGNGVVTWDNACLRPPFKQVTVRIVLGQQAVKEIAK